MSARSAQRTRWRRWRMGRDIAGRTGSRRTDEWLSPQLVAVVTTLRTRGQLLLLLLLYNTKKCSKFPRDRDHFINPQTQATSFSMENDHEKIEILN